MDQKRRKEEAAAKVKSEQAVKEIRLLMRDSMRLYHKEWNIVFEKQSRAAELLREIPNLLLRAGLSSVKLNTMPGASKRNFAREVMQITPKDDLAFVLEPRLPEIVIYDFLARDTPVTEMAFRVEAERLKARRRFDGEEAADHAARCIENGQRAQEVGLFKDAVKMYDGAREAIAKARDLFALVSLPDPQLEKRWEKACNDREGCPMLTREKQMLLESALRDREKTEGHWSERSWVVTHGMDHPTCYCLGTFKVGYAYSQLNRSEEWDHAPQGLSPDGSDTEHIIERLEARLEQALKDQEADLEFKALAICSVDELREAQQALIEAAREDVERGESEAAEAMVRVHEVHLPPLQVWEDLDEDALGEAAVTDEVLELHDVARLGQMRKLRWLIEECQEQHFWAVNQRYKQYKAVASKRVKVDSLNHESRTALFQCAKYNMHEAGAYLADAGADVNHKDLNEVAPLHVACGCGSSEMVKLLLDWGADLESRDREGQTALHYCARYALGNMDVLRSLVGFGADLNATDNRKQTPLHQVVKNRRYGSKELFFLNFLLLMGCDADARDADGDTPLDLCDDMEVRRVIKGAYSKQGELRVERWGPGGVPPPRDGVRPVTILEQVLKITGGVQLLCVLHKGNKAYVNPEACKACGIGLVVTVPYMGTSDFAHMCVNCAAKEVNHSHIRTGRFV